MRSIRGCVVVILVLTMMGCGLMSAPPIEVPMEITAEAIGTVDQTSSVVSNVMNNAAMSGWTLLLFTLLAGWAIPGPGEMLRGLVRVLAGPLGFLKWW